MAEDHGKLRGVVADFLTDVDPVFIEVGMPLHHRPLRAALDFAEHIVLGVVGGTKENPAGQVWFDAVYSMVLSWYRQRYGAAMSSHREGAGRGVVAFAGIALSLTVPLSIGRPGSDPSTIRLYFPRTLREDEDGLSFLDATLDLQGFPVSERAALLARIESVVARTRTLNALVRFADVPRQGREIGNRVLWTLQHAVESIASSQGERYGLAVWELNLVAELAIKLFLVQSGVTVPKDHDVVTLFAAAEAAGLPPIAADLLRQFPRAKAAIRFRYGEEAPPLLSMVINLYDAALTMAVHATSALKQGLSIDADGYLELSPVGALSRGA